jgi:alkanesulfonate monooxygenase SsuD/methylene tetrahydromethanopterin reductase-like flavin-dependent oxidoreductase (luciferase family)
MTRYGILSHVPGTGGAPDAYRDTLRYIGEAERIGYQEFWIAQHHFSPDFGHVSSPLVFLAHAGAAHPSLSFGVGVISLPFEEPVRLAEDIGTVQALLGDRVRIGLGPGNANAVFEAFGTTAEGRHALFADRLARLRALLDGARVDASTERVVWPPARPDAPGWLSQATYTPARAHEIGGSGLGLLVSVSHPLPPGTPAGATALGNQVQIVDAYLAGRGVADDPGAITATRAVFVSHDEGLLADAVDGAIRWFAGVGFGGDPAALRAAFGSTDDTALLERLGFSIGTPDHVRRRLEDDVVVQRSGTVLFQSLARDTAGAIESARLLHHEVLSGSALARS